MTWLVEILAKKRRL